MMNEEGYPKLAGKFLIDHNVTIQATGHRASKAVAFPVDKYLPPSKETDLKVYVTDSKTLHIVALDKAGSPLRTQWLILNASAIPDLILALQHLQAGPLGRVAVELDMAQA